MNTFSALSQRVKVGLISISLFLLSMSLGLLVFGENGISGENLMLPHAKEAAKADLLYIEPEVPHDTGSNSH